MSSSAPSSRNLLSGTASTVCVIVPTKNRPEELLRALRSVAAQEIRPEHVIVVDQSRQPIKAEVWESLDGIRLSYVYDPSITGASAARNRGMDLVDSQIVAFVDDDEILERNYIAELLRVYEQHPGAKGVSGVPTNYFGRPLAFRIWAAIWLRGPLHDDRQKLYWRASKEPFDAEPVTRFTGGFMSFRADAVRDRRFDEGLVGACVGEDIDFSYRFPPGSLFIAGKARLLHLHSTVRGKEHWLVREAKANAYLHQRLWSHGLYNRLCFAWMSFGFRLTAALVTLRTGDKQVLTDVICATKL